MKSQSGLWRKVLFAARRVVTRKETLTSETLATEFDLDVKTASSWLNILRRYGYVQHSGKAPANKRWAWTWELTQFGLDYKQAKKKGKPALRIASNPPPNQG